MSSLDHRCRFHHIFHFGTMSFSDKTRLASVSSHVVFVTCCFRQVSFSSTVVFVTAVFVICCFRQVSFSSTVVFVNCRFRHLLFSSSVVVVHFRFRQLSFSSRVVFVHCRFRRRKKYLLYLEISGLYYIQKSFFALCKKT